MVQCHTGHLPIKTETLGRKAKKQEPVKTLFDEVLEAVGKSEYKKMRKLLRMIEKTNNLI